MMKTAAAPLSGPFLFHAPLTSGKVSEILLPALPEEVHFLPGNHPILSQNFKILDTELPLASWDLVEYSGQALGFLCGPHKDSLLNIEKNIHWVFENHKAFYSLDQTNHLEPHLERTFARGRMNQVQSETSKVVEGEYSFAPQAVNLPLPLRATAFISEGVLFVKAPLPWPGQTLSELKRLLSNAPKNIEVIPEPYYQDFENRNWISSFLAVKAGVLAWILGREIQMEVSSFEEFLYGPKRPAVRVHCRSSLDANGQILGMEINAKLDMGARAFFAEEILDRCLLGITGVYRCRALKVQATAYKTNTPPNSSLGSVGEDLGLMALETHIQDIIEELDQDPTLWKSQNLLKKGNKDVTGYLHKDPQPYGEILDLVMKKTDFSRKYAVNSAQRQIPPLMRDQNYMRGIGLALGFQGNGFMTKALARASVTGVLEAGGVLHVYSSLWPRRGATIKKWKAKISSELEIPKGQIFFHRTITSAKEDSGLDAASRSFEIIGKLLLQCARGIAKKRFHDALPITVTKLLRKTPSWEWDGEKFRGVPFHSISYGAGTVDIAYDPISARVEVRKIFLAVEAGYIDNPSHAKSAIKEGIALALEWVFSPGAGKRDGKTLADNFYQLTQMSNVNIPEIEIQFLQPKDPKAVPKGLGNLGAILTAPALMQALRQVFQSKLNSLPVQNRFLTEVLRQYEK
jgi:CO/xanthine dehydrogenase Mo-binding subunit